MAMPETNTQRFTRPGLVHRPSPGNAFLRLSAPLAGGTYSKLRARLTVVHGGWSPGRESKTHNIFWLARNATHFDCVGFTNVQGPGSNVIFNRHGFSQKHVDKARMEGRVALEPGKTYHFDYVFDTAAKSIVLAVMEADTRAPIVTLHGVPNVDSIELTTGGEITVEFGFTDDPGANPNEPPTLGWEYRDFLLEVFQEGEGSEEPEEEEEEPALAIDPASLDASDWKAIRSGPDRRTVLQALAVVARDGHPRALAAWKRIEPKILDCRRRCGGFRARKGDGHSF